VAREVQFVDRDHIEPRTRALYTRASAVAIIGNALLFAAKGAAALATGSSAVLADAANSGSDVAYSLLMAIGLWASLRPPDAGHPHGHRRIEPLVGLAIGATMGWAGIAAVRSGISALSASESPPLTLGALSALLATGFVKTIMFAVTRRLGREANSTALQASARDNLSDIIASLVALAGYVGSQYLTPLADSLAAFGVALWVFRNAGLVLGEGFRHLTGGGAPHEFTESILSAAKSVAGVLDVDRIIVEHSGPTMYVDIHIKMAPDTSLQTTHLASHRVRSAIESLVGVDHAYVHVEPYGDRPQAEDTLP